jgi:hypothetical protein
MKVKNKYQNFQGNLDLQFTGRLFLGQNQPTASTPQPVSLESICSTSVLSRGKRRSWFCRTFKAEGKRRWMDALYWSLLSRPTFRITIHTFHWFIHQWLYSSLLCPGIFFSSLIVFTKSVGLLGRVISPSQGRYPHTEQHKHRINAHTDIHALSGIRTHDPSVRASEDSSYLRPGDSCDRAIIHIYWLIISNALYDSQNKYFNFLTAKG